MKTKSSFIFILLVCTCAFSQKSIYFPSFEAINVDKSNVYVAALLFKNYTNKNPKYKLVLPENFNKNTFYDHTLANKTQEIAKEKQTDYYILSDMMAVGDLLTIHMKMYETSSGRMVWADAMKLDALEDLEIVMRLFAEHIGSKTPATGERDIFSITGYENRELNKKGTNRSYGIYLIGGITDIDRSHLNFGAGALMSFDTRNLIIDLKFEFFESDDDDLWGVKGGVNIIKPLTQKAKTSFIGFGAVYGYTSVETKKNNRGDSVYYYSYRDRDRNGGIEIEGCFGYLINRTSKVSFRAAAYPFLGFYRVENSSSKGIRFGFIVTF